jgi:hypothetical protein
MPDILYILLFFVLIYFCCIPRFDVGVDPEGFGGGFASQVIDVPPIGHRGRFRQRYPPMMHAYVSSVGSMNDWSPGHDPHYNSVGFPNNYGVYGWGVTGGHPPTLSGSLSSAHPIHGAEHVIHTVLKPSYSNF